jgi:tetratricopeptide (TPR) repeat protein
MDWITLLRSQQADFIQRLKSGCLLHCETQGQHSEVTVISGEKVKHLRAFCWHMAEKYRTSPVRVVFINNLKGKLGEEVVKARLSDLVTELDYAQRLRGDGKVDFRLTSDPTLGIQVKARHDSIDTVRWGISQEEVEKNVALVCILIQEEVSEAQTEYNLIMAGFIPTNRIELSNDKASVGINELLYSGGLHSYLGSLKSSEADGFPRQQNQPYYAKAYYNRGNTRSAIGDKLGAIEDYIQVLNINPNYAKAYYERAVVRSGIRDKLGAIKDFEKAADFFQQQGDRENYQKALDKIGRFDIVAG